jgi:polyisoprenoid-binding protein YceI
MKKLFLLIPIAVLALTSAALLAPATYKVDAAKSTFQWTAKKMTGSHWGNVKFSGGTINVDKNAVTGGSFEMDMTSLDCQDLKGEMAGKLVGHLKSDDFFSTDKHPKATLTIKSITATLGKSGNGTHDVKADLVIKGISKEVSFPATIAMAGNQVTATADFNINRTLYDIKFRSGSFFENLGDKAIYDDFNVKVNIVATK